MKFGVLFITIALVSLLTGIQFESPLIVGLSFPFMFIGLTLEVIRK